MQANTHVDIIDWHGSRGFVGEEPALRAATAHLQARREGRADPGEPTGFLSHHQVHDEASWRFLARLFERTQGRKAVVWQGADTVFGCLRANTGVSRKFDLLYSLTSVAGAGAHGA